MIIILRMRKFFLLALLLLLSTHVDCLISFSFTYNNSVDSPIRQPAYPLGYIDGNTSIDFDIRAWNTLVTLSTVTASLVNAGTYTQVGSNVKVCTNTQICNAIFYVDTPGSYYLKLGQSAPSANYVEPFYLVVKTYPGHLTFVGNPQQKQILRTGDVLREFYVGKYFYIGSEATVNFKLGPFGQNPMQNPMAIYQTDPVTYAYSGPPNALTASYINGMLVGSRTLTPGYYFLVLNNAFLELVLTVFWESDNYACPYDPSYFDMYSIAQGCTHSKSQPGLPCRTYNNVTQTCTDCISGYILDPVSGSCYANTNCPPRQYYHFGSCLPVSDQCLDFNFFTGNCLSCVTEDFYLSQGQCIMRNVTCGQRQWRSGVNCFNVSDKCDAFDASTGNCQTCTEFYYHIVNGTCVVRQVNCPPGQIEYNHGCLITPAQCLNYDIPNGVCLTCIQGYYLQDGRCERIVCPPRQVPSRVGLSCVNVSPLCNQYNPLDGACLSCQLINYRVNSDGECVQVVSPLAGCMERQNLGFGACIGSEMNCYAYNLVTGDCDKCEQGFSINYTGICAKDVLCPAGKWGINGECLELPSNCIKVNQLGLCDQCENSNYRLEQGQCIFVVRCEANQYLSQSGLCLTVSKECGLFNPSSGQCITCKSGVNPQQGHCCPQEQVFRGNRCVDADKYQKSIESRRGQECVTAHPALGYCLICHPGFTPDPVTQTTCIPE